MHAKTKDLIAQVWEMKAPGLPKAEAAKGAYDWCVAKFGIDAVGEFDQYLPVKPAGYWTLERCKASALQYQSKSQWDTHARGAFKAASARGWLGICCAHMPEYVPVAKWTLERCKASALQYQSKNQWSKHEGGAFSKAWANGWMDICCAHMPKYVLSVKWTFETCRESAKKFTHREAWRKGERGAYNVAHEKGWIDSFFGLVSPGATHPPGYWTKDRCIGVARRYQSRVEWSNESNSSLLAAIKGGWIDECCSHMTEGKKPKGHWTKERCLESALKYATRADWAAKDSRAMSAAISHRWITECCAHMEPTKREYTLDECKASALRFTSRNAWVAGDHSSHHFARKSGWVEMCCTHMKPLRPVRHHTLETCLAEAAKHAARNEWKKADTASYQAAIKFGWYEACCAHMGPLPNMAWTLDRCKASAANYTNRSAWRRGYPGAVAAASKNGWFSQCCAHMEPGKKGRPRKPA
jgi:hypothetical protein